jgi:type II secretory pathway pseudopilin PulG
MKKIIKNIYSYSSLRRQGSSDGSIQFNGWIPAYAGMNKVQTRNNQKAFTLIELAVAFTIISLIVGSVLATLSKSNQLEKYTATQAKLEKISKAIRVYATNWNQLPCPGFPFISINDPLFGVRSCGVANAASPVAGTNVQGGMVPVAELGLPPDYAFDEWGRRIGYIMDEDAFNTAISSAPVGFTNYNIIIQNISGGVKAQNAAYVLISHGANGHLGLNARGVARIVATTFGARELENCPSDPLSPAGPVCTFNTTFVQNPPSSATGSNGYFDDIVIYRLGNELR